MTNNLSWRNATAELVIHRLLHVLLELVLLLILHCLLSSLIVELLRILSIRVVVVDIRIHSEIHVLQLVIELSHILGSVLLDYLRRKRKVLSWIRGLLIYPVLGVPWRN